MLFMMAMLWTDHLDYGLRQREAQGTALAEGISATGSSDRRVLLLREAESQRRSGLVCFCTYRRRHDVNASVFTRVIIGWWTKPQNPGQREGTWRERLTSEHAHAVPLVVLLSRGWSDTSAADDRGPNVAVLRVPALTNALWLPQGTCAPAAPPEDISVSGPLSAVTCVGPARVLPQGEERGDGGTAEPRLRSAAGGGSGPPEGGGGAGRRRGQGCSPQSPLPIPRRGGEKKAPLRRRDTALHI